MGPIDSLLRLYTMSTPLQNVVSGTTTLHFPGFHLFSFWENGAPFFYMFWKESSITLSLYIKLIWEVLIMIESIGKRNYLKKSFFEQV
jgi:hypothetical protein